MIPVLAALTLLGPVPPAVGAVAGLGPAAAVSDTLPGGVRGRIWSEGTGTPLPHAVVELGPATEGGPGERTTRADAGGGYRLSSIPPGVWTIRAFALDHAPLEVEVSVPAGREVELDLSLGLHPVSLTPITATVFGPPGAFRTTGRVFAAGQGRGDPAAAALRALETTPGVAELGLAEAARIGNGNRPGDPTGVLYVRGAAADLKLVLLDGAPVYAPFHLGGLLEGFQPDVLRSSRLYLGGAPARYDGGLSYVLDLRTRRGDRERVRSAGAVDLLGAGVRVEGPVGGASWLLAGRGLHTSVPSGLVGGDPLPYGYGDLLARLDIPAGSEGAVSATGFWNRESVRLAQAAGFPEPASWGNAAGSVRYQGPLGAGELELTGALSRFDSRLPVSADTLREAAGRTARARLAADYSIPLGKGTRLGAGASYDRHLLEVEVRDVEGAGAGTGPFGDETEGEALGSYAELLLTPAAELEVRAGLRGDVFLPASRGRLAPRLAVAWRPGERTTLSVALGRFHQYVRAPETILSADLDGLATGDLETLMESGAGSSPAPVLSLGIASSTHLTVGLEDEVHDGIRLGLEGFFKSFDELPGTATVLRASGADLWLQGSGGPWSGWLGYSLAWVWTDETVQPDTDRFAGRHLLSGGLDGALRGGLEVGLRLSYGAGLSFTAVPIVTGPAREEGFEAPDAPRPEPPAAAEDPPFAGAPAGSYLRLDARVARSWAARLGGGEVEITPYLRVLNALDRRDALFYHFDPDRDLQPRSLGAVPLLPIVGVEWRL